MWPRAIRPGYLAFTVVFICLALAFGGPVAIGAVWLWVLLGALDFAWALVVGLQTAVLYRFRPGNYTAGDPLDAEIQIANDGWLFAPAVTLRDGPRTTVAFVGGARTERYSLPPLARLEIRRAPSARRGHYRLGPVEIGTEGPFGLFAWVRHLHSEHEVTVLPRLHPLPHWPLEQAEAYGRAVKGHSPYPDPTLVVTTRPMLPGDSPRRIHWKRSARTGALQVREVEPSAGGHGVVVLDLWVGAYGRSPDPRLLDAATEMAASAGHAILRSGATLSFFATGSRPAAIVRARGTGALGKLLDLLAEVEADGPHALRVRLPALAQQIPPRSVAVLVTPAHPSGWAGTLPVLQGRGATVAAVLVLPPWADGDAVPAAVRHLRQIGCPAWAASSAEQLAGRLWPQGVLPAARARQAAAAGEAAGTGPPAG